MATDYKKLIRTKAPILYRLYHRTIRTLRMLRKQKFVTIFMGPKWSRSRKRIELCLTYACNLRCYNCDMSVRQATSTGKGADRMSLDQVKAFIQETLDKKIKWEQIRLLGGEPTVHPEFHEIVRVLKEFKDTHSPETNIQIVTNGHGDAVKKKLAKLPKDIVICNSNKEGNLQDFTPFNVAPQDCLPYKFADYRNGCFITSECGIGLTPSGYYPCVVAGGIDRITGYNKGRQSLPKPSDDMAEDLKKFCRICGHFRAAKIVHKEIMSPTWQKAYAEYKKKKPTLSVYGSKKSSDKDQLVCNK